MNQLMWVISKSVVQPIFEARNCTDWAGLKQGFCWEGNEAFGFGF
ncbi:hypothetical protein QWZ13_06705 [Reinekea marina]|nr:hypothetical protein [Reinekea marina]MDN3648600.1 hypothetical protein [Reinekea marina]